MSSLSTQTTGRSPSTIDAGAAARTQASEETLRPPVDVIEDAQGITLYADLPGVSRDDLHLQVEAETLTIDAQMRMSVPEELQSVHTEVGAPRFHRVFTLSKELDADGVTAELSQGVLMLRIPKAAHAQPRRIEVKPA